jgi:hypothetical protein
MEYTFALVIDSKLVALQRDWNKGSLLRSFVSSHPGNYIAFIDNGAINVVDDASTITEAAHLHESVQVLADEQSALESQQEPLRRQQLLLRDQMRGASGPQQMQRIGADQARIGAKQAEIGREQGRVGVLQGERGRAFYQYVQRSLRQCAAQKHCTISMPSQSH